MAEQLIKDSPFMFISDENVDQFIADYVDGEEITGKTDIYNKKVAFLGSTGKIATHRLIYGAGQQVIKFTVKNTLQNVTMSFTNSVVDYGTRYENTITVNDGYSLKSISISVGGIDVTDTAWNPETNTITIDYVTGNIMISGTTLRGCSISYTLPNCTSSVDIVEVEEEQSYRTIIKANEGYNISNIQVLMGGSDISSTVVSNINSDYVINISSVTNDIQIIVSTSLITFTISEGVYDGVNLTYEHTVFYGGTATINIEVLENYEIRENKIVVTENGVERTFTYTDGVLTIDNVKGDIVFNIDCAATYNVTYIFNNVTSSNTASTITDQDVYETVLSFDTTTYNSVLVTITMNGEDITSSSYDIETKTIIINKPTGDITIHGEAIAATIVNYVNKLNLTNQSWKFYKIRDVSTEEFDTSYSAVDYDDSFWLNINIPYDWSIYNPFNISQSGSEYESGWLSGGDAVYRTKFDVTAEQIGKKMYIYFDGVYMTSEIFINGVSVGTNKNGYSPFEFDITNNIVEGTNVIAVYVSNRLPSSRWYSGSGIFREAYIYGVNVSEIGTEDITITTPNLATEKDGTVTTNIKFNIENITSNDIVLKEVKACIYKRCDNTKVGEAKLQNQTIIAGTTTDIELNVGVNQPVLWTTHDKSSDIKTYLAQVIIQYTDSEGKDYIVYSNKEEFGYRYISYDNNGFYLNGEKTFLKGTCLHHDNGPLGSETNESATIYKLRILKDMGCNTIRCTHNPESKVFLTCAMRMGFMIIEELFDGWSYPKNGNTYDYSRFFSISDTYKEIVIKNVIRRDKNNPSIIMWSLGNEVSTGCGTGTTEKYYEDCQLINTYVKKYDTTRPTTVGCNEPNNSVYRKIMAEVDIPGINYGSDSEYSSLRSSSINGVSFSTKCIYGSETTSPFYTRGIYETSASNKYFTCFDYSNSEHTNAHTNWGDSSCVALRRHTDTYTWLAGLMPWTGFDYIGEPTPVNNNTVRSSFFGVIDLVGLKKDVYYLYQSKWTTTPMIHIVPEDWTIWSVGAIIPVWIYSNCPNVKLHLNGVELTPKYTPTTGAHYAYEYEVTYAKGTLVATGYYSQNNIIAQDIRFSTSEASMLKLKPDKTQVIADGKNLVYVEIDVCDSNGNVCPRANNNIKITCDGGKVIATDNGYPACFEDMRNYTQTAFAGKLVAIVQPNNSRSIFTVNAVDTSNSNISGSVNINLGDTNIYADYSNNTYIDPENPPYYIDIIDFELSTYNIEIANGSFGQITLTKNPVDSTSIISAKSNKEGILISVNNDTNIITILANQNDIAGTIVVSVGDISKIVNVKFGAGSFSDPILYIDDVQVIDTANIYKFQYQKYNIVVEGREIHTIESLNEDIMTVNDKTKLLYGVADGVAQLKVTTTDNYEFTFYITVSTWKDDSNVGILESKDIISTMYASSNDTYISLSPGILKSYTLKINQNTSGNIYVVLDIDVDAVISSNIIANFGYNSDGTKKSYIVKYVNKNHTIKITQTKQGVYFIDLRTYSQQFKYKYICGTVACTDIQLDSDVINIVSDYTNNLQINYTILPENCTESVSFKSIHGKCCCTNGSLYANYKGADIIEVTCGSITKNIQVNISGITEDGTVNCFNATVNGESMYYVGDANGIEWSSTHCMYAEFECGPENGAGNVVSWGQNINSWNTSKRQWHIYYPCLCKKGNITNDFVVGYAASYSGSMETWGIGKTMLGENNNIIRIAQGPTGIWINGVNCTGQANNGAASYSNIQSITNICVGSLEGANRFYGVVKEIRIIPQSSLAAVYKDTGLTDTELEDLSLNGMDKYKYIGAYESTGEDTKTEQELDSTDYSMPMTLSSLSAVATGESINGIIVNPHVNNGYILGYNNGTSVGDNNGFNLYSDMQMTVDAILSNNGSGDTANDIYRFIMTKTDTNKFTIKLSSGYGPTGDTGTVSWSTTLIDYTISDITTVPISSTNSLISDYKDQYLIRLANPDGYYLNAGGGANYLNFSQTDNEWSVWYIFKCLK